jgi:NAD(P)-dependent dehydrogenase (short-subunit alcohol dehydrogenase family)
MAAEPRGNALFSLHGKVALVTGASSGLGAHFARVLAQAGATVAVAARRTDRLAALVSELESAGARALAVAMDVTSADSVDNALNVVEESLGVVTVLVNNAGVADAKYCLKVDEENWDFTMEPNLKGAWRVATGMARRCAAAGSGGSIVNIASILGLRVGFGQSTYATSKAALVQLTKSMALELGAKGIRVNALCPGYFLTDMNESYLNSEAGRAMLDTTPFRRSGELSELDGPLLLLASDAGSFMTGAAVPVDGGHLVSSL